MNRKAFNRINYGLFLVGSVLDGKYQGCVVNSLHQITSTNPAKFSLSLNKSNETYKAVEAAGPIRRWRPPAASRPPCWSAAPPKSWWTCSAISPVV